MLSLDKTTSDLEHMKTQEQAISETAPVFSQMTRGKEGIDFIFTENSLHPKHKAIYSKNISD